MQIKVQSSTQREMMRWKVFVPKGNGRIGLGKPSESQDAAGSTYHIGRRVLMDANSGEVFVVRQDGDMHMGHVVEVLDKVFDVKLSAEEIAALVKHCVAASR